MNNEELNVFAENYLKNDKTQKALMITGSWGSGKSYYVRNKLCPYLKERKFDYVVISLYGINDIKEISKNIYIELRTKNITNKNEVSNIVKIVSKTVVKGITSFFNVDLNQNDNDWQVLYESINLSNKLIILEDLERSNLDITELLGFVNNLVEQDGTKVLLISNESEIIKYEEKVIESKKEKILSEISKRYLKIKEKTIGDTIHFTSDVNESIVSIIKSFSNNKFDEMLNDSLFVQNVAQELYILNNYNFRTLLYASQKMDEITKKIESYLNIDFLKNMFLGIVAYSSKLNNDENKVRKDLSYTSYDLGSFIHPLFKSSFDYIEKHTFNIDVIKKEEKLFLGYSNENEINEEFKEIFKYYISDEKNLENNIKNLKKKLDANSILNYNQYIRLFNYLVSIKYNVGFEKLISECKEKMLSEIKKAIENGYSVDTFNFSGIELLKNEEKTEFDEFIKEIDDFNKNFKNSIQKFSYNCFELKDFYENLSKKKDELFYENGFISKLDVSKIRSMIEESNAEDINYLRRIIKFIYYRFTDIKQYYLCDLESLKELSKFIQKATSCENLDKIKKLQLNWLLEDLNKIILKIEN